MPPRNTRSKAAAAAAEADEAATAAAEAPVETADVEMRPVEEEEAKQGAAKAAAAAAVDDGAVGGDGDGDDDDLDSNDSSSSSEDSDFEEVDASEEDAAALSKLEEEMESSAAAPPSFESHLALISLLRRCRMSRRLREARRAAAAAFPLPEPVWLEWLEDERREAARAREKAEKRGEEPRPGVASELVALHEAAVADFLSVPVWASYLRSLRELDGDGDASRFRAVADRALAVAGAHVGKGEALWREARRFELDALRNSATATAAATAAAAAVADEGRARSLFHRQLSTPLLYYERCKEGADEDDLSSNEHVRKELLEWERERDASFGGSLPPWLVAAADAASSAAAARAASEEAVSGSSSSSKEELLAAHLAYIRLEERALASAKGDRRESLRRCLVAHERAVAAFPLTAFLWCSLGSFAEGSYPEDPAAAASVYKRALRNCPWVGELWARALRAAERRGEKTLSSSSSSSSDEEFDAIFRAAMSAPLSSAEDFVECILCRLDRMRRREEKRASDSSSAEGGGGGGSVEQQQRPLEELRAAFREASQWLSAAFPLWEDPGLRLASYLPQLELALPGAGGPEAAARAWEQFAAAPAPAPADAANAAAPPPGALSAEFFVSWARAAVESGLARGAGPRSPQAVALGRAILKRALGLDSSKKKDKGAKAAKGGGAGGGDAAAAGAVALLPPTKKLSAGPAAAAAVAAGWLRFEREWGSAEEHFAASLRAAPLLEAAAVAASAAGAAAAPSSLGGGVGARRAGAAGPGMVPSKAVIAQQPERRRTKGELLALRRERDPNFNKNKKVDKDAPAKRARTEGAGAAAAGGEASVSADQQQQQHRQQSPAAPFVPRAADAEHRTAFVRGFPASATEAALAEFFAKAAAASGDEEGGAGGGEGGGEAPAPPLPVVRRPKGPDGRPRGFAYVEFCSKEALARAVAAADGKKFCEGGAGAGGGEGEDDGSVLSVAVSRPPAPAGGGGRGGRGGGGGGGGGGGSFGGGGRGRGRGRAGLGFFFGGGGGGGGGGPSSAAAAAPAAAATAAPSPFVPRVVASGAAAPPKSNADFRAMLLGGKK